eukprot:3710920-Pyramimonas_sp.AAC.1
MLVRVDGTSQRLGASDLRPQHHQERQKAQDSISSAGPGRNRTDDRERLTGPHAIHLYGCIEVLQLLDRYVRQPLHLHGAHRARALRLPGVRASDSRSNVRNRQFRQLLPLSTQ